MVDNELSEEIAEEAINSPEPTQPEATPSGEAGAAAAGESLEAELARLRDQLRQEQTRRQRQQSVLDQRAGQLQQERDTLRQEMDQLRSKLDETVMSKMTEPDRARYIQSRERDELERARQELDAQRFEVENRQHQLDWYNYWLKRGIPQEVLNQAEDFGQMTQLADDYRVQRIKELEAGKTAEPQPKAAPVTKADLVSGGAVGTPSAPRMPEPGTKEWADWERELVKQYRRGGTAPLT